MAIHNQVNAQARKIETLVRELEDVRASVAAQNEFLAELRSHLFPTPGAMTLSPRTLADVAQASPVLRNGHLRA